MEEEERRATDEERRLLERLAVPAGLCASCEHLRLLASRRSVFVRCGLAAREPGFPRYPPLPVVVCGGYLAQEPGTAGTAGTSGA